ncbi:c-type cytochrome [Acidocella sp. C78]|uniref:c-type cytochrome n=1 Tax=Acidocella sp. C78 TaxID=1671486 RepID=UPI00191BC62C|nr:cytochrome c [Acidocella sp. C78]
MTNAHRAMLGLAAAAMLALPGIASAGCASGDFTAAQAATGKTLYDANCAACHMTNMEGGSGPAIGGAKFKSYLEFTKITGAQLLAFIKSQMPYQAPGSLKPAEYDAIFAYVLQHNGYSSGATALDAKTASCVKMLPYPGKS